ALEHSILEDLHDPLRKASPNIDLHLSLVSGLEGRLECSRTLNKAGLEKNLSLHPAPGHVRGESLGTRVVMINVPDKINSRKERKVRSSSWCSPHSRWVFLPQ
ncbi:mCG146151, partial [Mus musculus]